VATVDSEHTDQLRSHTDDGLLLYPDLEAMSSVKSRVDRSKRGLRSCLIVTMRDGEGLIICMLWGLGFSDSLVSSA
jgi:hypothetical protein